MYSGRGQQMFEYLSWYYANSRIMQSVLDSQGIEIDAARTAVEASLYQFYAKTADWGIELWEKELAITPPNDASLELRQAMVKAKLMTAEVMTPERIVAIANYFIPAKDAILVPTVHPYTFRMAFPSAVPYISEMLCSLNTAKPAHLAMELELRRKAKLYYYIGGAVLSGKNITIGLVQQFTINSQKSPLNIGSAVLNGKNITIYPQNWIGDSVNESQFYISGALLSGKHITIQ